MMPSSAPKEHEQHILPFRNPQMLYALSQEFERRFEEYKDAVMFQGMGRPEYFPRVFKSRWDMAWHLRSLSDDEALQLLRLLQSDPADLLQPRFAEQRVEGTVQGVRRNIDTSMTPEQVTQAGFPRIWRESAA